MENESEKSVSSCSEVETLKKTLESLKRQLHDSENKRISLQEDLDRCRHNYESEIGLLKHQLEVYQEDFQKVNTELESTKEQLSRAKEELSLAQSLAVYNHQYENRSTPSLEELRRQREEALARYREQYEQRRLANPSAYQTDSYDFDSDGEDEIDGIKMA